jgi:hypothetical protein
LACHVLAPSFKVAYGNPHLYRDFETGELTDVWQPVVADFLRRGK